MLRITLFVLLALVAGQTLHCAFASSPPGDLTLKTSPTVPGPPRDLQATAIDGESVLLEWLPPRDSILVPTLYAVYYSTSFDDLPDLDAVTFQSVPLEEQQVDVGALQPEDIFTEDGKLISDEASLFGVQTIVRGLSPNTEYEFIVRAIFPSNKGFLGTPSKPSNKIVSIPFFNCAPTAPAPPFGPPTVEGLSVKIIQSGVLEITWINAQTSREDLAYDIFVRPDTASRWDFNPLQRVPAGLQGNEVSISITVDTSVPLYYIRVIPSLIRRVGIISYNIPGCPSTTVATGSKRVRLPPTPPTFVKAFPGDNSIKVTFFPSIEGPVKRYVANVSTPQLRSSGSNERSKEPDVKLPLSFTVDQLTNGQEYSIVLFAENNVGRSAPSNLVQETPNPSKPIPKPPPPLPPRPRRPSPPRDLRLVPKVEALEASWLPPEFPNGNVEYSIIVELGDTTRAARFNPGLNRMTGERIVFVLSPLAPGQQYTIRVIAVNRIGPSNPSNPALGTPLFNGPPGGLKTAPTAPRGLTATAGDRSVTLSWLAPLSTGGSPILRYFVNIDDGSPLNLRQIPLNDSNGLSRSNDGGNNPVTTTIEDLVNGVPYSFFVTAINEIGMSPPSDTVTATPTGFLLRTPQDPCSCTSDGQSGDISTGFRGCFAVPNAGYYCYVVNPDGCNIGIASQRFPGAEYRRCNP